MRKQKGRIELMKILQINVVCGNGSTGKIATDIYDILVKNGHECKIAYGRGEANNIPQQDAIRIGTDIDVKIHAGMTRLTDRTGFYSSKATRKLISEIEVYGPDVIHLHNIHGYFINIEILFEFLERYKKPVIWTLHDCWSFTGHCSYFDYVQCYKWKTQCNKCPQKTSYPKSSLLDNSKQNYIDKKRLFTSVEDMTIVTPSNWLAGLVKESYLGKYPVKVIPNGIDLEKFKPNKGKVRDLYHIGNKKMILGVANIWDKRKGFDDFIALSEILEPEYVIILVGLSEKQIANIPNNIIGVKRTTSVEELAQLYTQADIFLNPSVEETMGLVTVEALACGTPVIVYNATAIPEVVNSDSGIIIEKNNVRAIKNAIDEIVRSEKYDSEICILSARKYEKNKMFNKYLELYKHIGKGNI